MGLNLGDLWVILRADKRPLEKGLDAAQARVNRFGSGIADSLKQSLSFATGQIITQGINTITSGIRNAAATAFDSVASYEGLTLSLEALIARQLRAGDSTIKMSDALAVATGMTQQLLGWVQKLAIQSPFEDEDINKVVQLASSYRFGVQQTKQLTQSLVDAGAAGNATGAQLEAATRALGQMNLKGKVSAEELNQLNEAGFGFASTLERMGVTLDDVSSGSVSATKFISAFIEQMAEESEGAAQRTMNSWTGLISTLTSMIRTGLREFTTGLLEPLRPLLEALGNAASADGLRESLRSLGEMAGNLVAPAIEFLTGKIEALPAFFERAAGFIRQFRDEMSGLTAGDILAGLPGQLDQIQANLNQTLDTLSRAHEGTLANLQGQIDKAGEAMGQKMAEIAEKYAPKIAEINERTAKAIANIQERIADSIERFNEETTERAEEHAKRRADIEKQIGKALETQEERLTELKRDHARKRRELTMDLLTAETEEQYLQIQSQIKAEDERHREAVSKTKEATGDQVAELQARLDEEDKQYAKEEAKRRERHAEELADLQASIAEQEAERDKQLAKVIADRAKEEAEVKASYDRQVADLQARIDQENQLYAQAVQEQKDLAAEAAADAEKLAKARASALGTGPAHEWAEWVKSIREGGLGALAEWVTGKLNEVTTAVNTWVNDPATAEQFRTWGRSAGQAAIDGIVSLLTGEGSQTVAGGLTTALLNAWVAVNTLPITLATYFVEGFIGAVTTPENVEKLTNGIASALKTASDAWAATLATWAGEITAWFGTTAEEWAAKLTSFDWAKVAQSVVDGIGTTLLGGLNSLKNQAAGTIAGMAQAGMNAIQGKSPSKLFADTIGASMVGGIKVGFEQGLPDLRKTITQGMQSLTPPQPAAGALAGAVGGTTQYINLTQTNNLPQAPAGFDRGGLLNEIEQRTINLLAKFYEKG